MKSKSSQEKLFGKVIHNRLTFEPHVENLKKAGQKHHALDRIAN